MCGFAGFISFNESQLAPDQRSEILEKMGTVLSRRGPDEQTTFDDGHLSFVFRRLSIVDVEHGTQPIWNEDHSRFICVNGEIYNHEKFREELAGRHRFSTQSDSEAVLHLHEEYGEGCFEKLNGMFAMLLYDSGTRSLTLARDRLGIKPLYWTRTDNGLIFASELKALLLHPDCPREVNWRDLDLPVTQQKRTVSTYVKDVHHLEAGSYLSVEANGDIKPAMFWRIEDHFRHQDQHFQLQDAVKNYENLITDSTTKRLMSDVPVGLYLSGGIDSSLLAAIAARSEKNLHCFTVVENTTVSTGDAPQAVRVAKQLGVPLYAAHFDVDEIAENFTLRDLERTIVIIESPRFDPEWIFKCELHRFAKQQVPDLKVVLLGQGADEFAGGYSNRAGGNFENWNDYLAREVAGDVRFYFGYEKGIPDYLRDKINLDHFDHTLDSRSMDYHEKMLLHVFQMQHFNLWHEDRSSSFYGLEARVPYLDHRLVELTASFPDQSLETLFWDKSVVRKALANSLEDYPKDRKKVPFIATENHSTIDNFVLMVAAKLYPAFRMLYQEMDDTPLFHTEKLDELHDVIESGNDRSILLAWELMAMMSLAIFEKFCRNPDVFLSFIGEDEGPVCRRVSQDELHRLDELYPVETVVEQDWALSSVVRIPNRVRLLSGLNTVHGDTDLFLQMNGQVAKTLTIPLEDVWVVDMLGHLANHEGEPADVRHWSDTLNVHPQQLLGALDYLVRQGFLERTA